MTRRLSRAARRRLERAVEKLLGADECTLCHRPLPGGSVTSGGATADGTPAVVGECCAERLAHVVGIGVFLTADHPTAAYAAQAADTAARAGLPDRPFLLAAADGPWKADDRAWFAARPDRAHRMRPMFPGEAPTLMRDPPPALPPGYAWRVLVRQVAPGERVKLAAGWDTSLPIPDIEPVLHAMFDLVAARGASDEPVLAEAVAALALRYSEAADGEAH